MRFNRKDVRDFDEDMGSRSIKSSGKGIKGRSLEGKVGIATTIRVMSRAVSHSKNLP